MPSQALPEAEDVRSLFNSLLGRDITVAVAHPESVDIAANLVVASYLRDDNTVAGVAVSDLAVASYAGASLAMIPKGMAEESIKDGVVAENLLENFHEVLNVAAAWFNAKGNPHASLGAVYESNNRPPQDVAVVMGGPADRVDFDITIAGYGTGKLRLLATTWT